MCYIPPRYPHCLAFLDMLTDETETGIKFRAEMAQQQFQEFVHQQQVGCGNRPHSREL